MSSILKLRKRVRLSEVLGGFLGSRADRVCRDLGFLLFGPGPRPSPFFWAQYFLGVWAMDTSGLVSARTRGFGPKRGILGPDVSLVLGENGHFGQMVTFWHRSRG